MDKKSRYIGVNWDQAKQRWRACITVNGKTYHLGYFDREDYAAKSHDLAAVKHFGVSATLNFK